MPVLSGCVGDVKRPNIKAHSPSRFFDCGEANSEGYEKCMNGLDAVWELACALDCPVKRNASMKEYTSFRTGGSADMLVEPRSEEQLSQLLRCCDAQEIQPVILGNGSNVLVSDDGIRGLVLCLAPGLDSLAEQDGVITCGAGVSMTRLCRFALEKGLTGLEFAFGIPGSAGGAAFMNAGAYGGEMKDVLIGCTHLTQSGERGSLMGNALALGYRHSAYRENGFLITSLMIRLAPGDKAAIRARMEELIGRRKAKQPLEYPSAGSTFKRPEGYYAGALIENCGLKGKSVGGAQVSEKHAGFVINTGNASSSDILELIRLIQDTVYREKCVRLEPEVRFLGF